MAAVVVIGAQWGDEGKGKVVDLFTESAHAVVRYSGGANAGHTLVIDGQTLVTRLIPSGVLHRGTLCILGEGMVVDPHTLLQEIATCRARGLLADGELRISPGAHVILPYHRVVEELREARANAIGTTKRGIGPAYEAKAGRRGVRVRDLLRPERLRQLVRQNFEELAPMVSAYGGELPAMEPMIEEALAAGTALAPHITETGPLIERTLDAGHDVLFEGAQGTLLDLDHGTYPYVTSSSTVAAGACQGAGIGPTRIDRVIGILKAYTTRVGEGPFPTELSGAEADALRKAGGEFGATTGRPRRCGWLDLPALRLAKRVNGLGGLAITKLDILSGRAEIPVCTHYRLDGQLIDELPTDLGDIERVEPVLEKLPGWQEDISHVRSMDRLPTATQNYVRMIAEAVDVPLVLLSVGPERKQTIVLGDPFSL